MKYENLIFDACDRFPEVKKEFVAQEKAGDINESLGQHIFFSFVFNKILFCAINEKKRDVAQRMFSFLEEMETSSDPHIAEVAEFTVLEELCDNYKNVQFEKYLGPESKLALKSIREYMPERT